MRKHLSVHFTDNTYNILHDYANKHGMPMAYVVRVAVTSWMSRKGLFTK